MDFAFRQAVAEGWIDSSGSEFTVCMEFFKSLAESGELRVCDNNLPTNKGSIKPAEAFCCLYEDEVCKAAVDQLHDTLFKKSIWTWKRGVIEAHLGKTYGKNEVGLNKLADRIDNNPFEEVIDDYVGVQRLMDWLKQQPIPA